MPTIKNIFNPRYKENGGFFYSIKKIINYRPKNIQLFEEAFTHRSNNDNKLADNQKNFERMEFLVDAIIS